GNLLHVAQALRKQYPKTKLLICADDDYQTEGNPGITRAREAAQAVGGMLAIPVFGERRPQQATDFNDLHQYNGLDAVRQCIASVIDSDKGKHAQTKNDASSV